MDIKWEYLEATFHFVENETMKLFIIPEYAIKYGYSAYTPVEIGVIGKDGWNLITGITDLKTNESRLVFRRTAI